VEKLLLVYFVFFFFSFFSFKKNARKKSRGRGYHQAAHLIRAFFVVGIFGCFAAVIFLLSVCFVSKSRTKSLVVVVVVVELVEAREKKKERRHRNKKRGERVLVKDGYVVHHIRQLFQAG
jgi:fatty acid desaturase